MVQTKKASEETICDQKMLGGKIVLGGGWDYRSEAKYTFMAKKADSRG